ncbi:hypothetical protein Prudu_004117, partial [Prunus dulcis]
DSHTVAHKERPKGDAGRPLKASVWRRSPLKKRPKGDAGVLRETQGDDQIILRNVQNTPGVPQGGPWCSPTS